MESKATAVLLRLKEMDKKYKLKSIDNNKLLSDSSNEHEILRPTLSIQMPETHVDDFGNYSLINEQELTSSVKVFDETVVSSNINSKLEEKSRAIENIAAEISELSISEVLDESDEFIDKNSIKIDETCLLTVNTIETRENTSESKSSVLLKNEDVIERYSEDSFESNSSFDDESKATKNETVKSDTFTALLKNMNSSEEIELMENINEDPVIISDNSGDDFINKNDDVNIESEKSRESPGEIKNNNSNSNVTSNFQRQMNKSLISIEETSDTNDLSIQSVEGSIRNELNVKTDVKLEDKRLDSSELNEIKDSEVSIKLKNFENIAEVNSEKTCNGENDEIEIEKGQSQKQVGDSVHRRISRKGRNRKTRKDQQIRMDHRRIPSSVIHYLKRLDEENRHSRLFPSRLIFPEAVGVNVIKPLEFPKILKFSRSECREQESEDPTIEFLRWRLTEIRKWLENQYILYREHCDLAVSINHNYEPVTVENTKKIIHHLREEMKFKKIT